MKVNILSKTLVFNDFFKIEKWVYQYKKPGGSETEPVDRMVFKRQDSAAVILFNTDTGKVILTRQYRHCTEEKGPGWMIEIIAGRLDDGEKPEDALHREAMEEAGYRMHSAEKIAMVYASPGCSEERMFIYYSEVTDADKVAPGGGLEEEGEYIELVEYSLSELQAMVLADELNDAKSLIAAQYLIRKHLG